ncbi:IS4 family transposase [Gloeothece verrucosa]|uniref:Transposase IS4 family protein n=1 Tax=Gloeothece verrucosa (strain PCC 7822) TaxID=497965 RepID=E0ULS7_GLOV7|nr:IS4 family transposase [Gloeothece verrucosa]ADN17907.1 transposase IS4 family protein [Gloeothece verrucosa PCC 7822]
MIKNNLLPLFYTEHLKTQLKRSEFLICSVLLTLLQSHRWVRIEELATQFPQKILFESRRKKIQRFLSLSHLNLETIWFPLFNKWLTRSFSLDEVLYVAIDRTSWGKINLLMISLIYDRRAIPIYWEILPKKGNTNYLKQKSAIEKVLALLKNYKKVILGDREFCSVDLAKWLRSQSQTYFCLRLKKNEYIEIESDLWIQLKDMGVVPGVSIYLKGVKVTKTKKLKNAYIVARWKRKYRGWSAEEAWFILTNLDDLDVALKAYAKRFGIEEMFRDFKSGGYNLEETGVQGKRLSCLILLIALAYSSAIISGENMKKKGKVKYICRQKEPRRTQRRHSSFYIGLHGKGWIECLDDFREITQQLMALSPHKKPYYQRGQNAIKLIRSTL